MQDYDFKTKIDQANLDMARLFELQEARFNIEIINARYKELQSELENANNKADRLEKLANTMVQSNHIYKAMMNAVNEYDTVKSAFEEFLAIMKLADSDIESKMVYKAII